MAGIQELQLAIAPEAAFANGGWSNTCHSSAQLFSNNQELQGHMRAR